MKRRALYYAAKGLNPSAISRTLGEEGQQYSRKSVSMLLRKVRETGIVSVESQALESLPKLLKE